MDMKKTLMWVLGVILVLGCVGGCFFMKMMQPLYTPGDLNTNDEYADLLSKKIISENDNYFIFNDGSRLYFETQGNGSIPAIVIHGGPGIPYDEPWEGLKPLENKYTFYYYHQRGCGNSTRPIDKLEGKYYDNMKTLNYELGLPAQLSDIDAIRRHLGMDKIVLVGHSFGGFMATLYSYEFSDKVESMILISPAEVIKMPQKDDGMYGAVKDLLPEEDVETYDALIKDIFNYGKIFDKSEKDICNETIRFAEFYGKATNTQASQNTNLIGGWMQHAMFISMGAKHDYTDKLKDISQPCLILHGDADIFTKERLDNYINNLPNAKLKLLKGGTHFSFNDAAEEFGEEVINFLK